MAHMLAKLKGVKVEEIGKVLKADASVHAEQGFFLQHLWQNVDDSEEVLFLFRSDDLNRAKQFVYKVHAQARNQDPHANLPHITFLEEK